MEKTSTTVPAIIGLCREWCRETEAIWPRLQRFVEQMSDRIRIREAGVQVQRELPEGSHTVAELAYWQVQWVLGMEPAQLCDNTVAIARFCRVFLFAGELDRSALPPGSEQLFEELLEYTQWMETTLLMEIQGSVKSHRLEQLADAIHRSCRRLPEPARLSRISQLCGPLTTLSGSGQ
ncbi:hypothetical protein [Microbulbifer rhizosphaerae]|uniref:Uncharacterized protein n=1 Tax=Microbulbifer rhizosphaerae TaxID=1562603 RepID=A0A7W4WCZ0_9GAMM|nr:hypothetical protein [Microbulbifer rhizosphaerae]MBB3061296.1 hypothetical protein [Microbulbifer rhizosphaerae]